MAVINAKGIHYKDLNKNIRKLVERGEEKIVLNDIMGQRYIGNGIDKPVEIVINGIPGNDMAAFASGVKITVRGNVQDAVANTMGEGKLIVYGDARDVLGYSMRGGSIYIKGDVGYRAGIHMKGYQDKQPVIIIGGTAGNFLGEYMAGGRIVILGLEREQGGKEEIAGNFIGAGMHGGVIYIRDKVKDYQVGLEVEVREVDEKDRQELRKLLIPYCKEFDLDINKIMDAYFSRLTPVSSRPYGKLYAY